MKKVLIPLVTLLVLSFLIAGCSSSPATTTAATVQPTTSAPVATTAAPTTTKPAATTSAAPSTLTPVYGGILRLMDTRAPSTTLGWYAESGAQFLAPAFPCVETLVRVTFENKVVPWLCESYTVADDLKSITFVVRKNVKFQDGSDLTGAVVKWNLDQQIAAKVSAASAWSSVDLVNDYSVRVNLGTWRNTLLNDFCTAAGTIVSKAAFDSVGKEGMRWKPVGTGAFKFVSFQRDVSVKYTKNTNYWQAGKPYLDGVEYSFSSDPMTEAAAFQNTEVDSLGDNVGQTLSSLLQTQKGTYLNYNPSGIAAMSGDSANDTSPWARLKVRQALDYAIDRDAIVKVRGFGYSATVYQFAYPGTPAYITNLAVRSYDPAKAKQLIAEAGYPNGFDTTLWCDSSACDKDSMTAVQGYLKAVGINATFNWTDNATIVNMRSAGWKNGLVAGIAGLDANMNNSIARNYIKATPYYPCYIKTDAFDAIYNESLNAKAYDPVLVQKMIQSLYDNAISCCLWTVNHANINQSYVHDGGWMSLQTWPGWTPENAWMSKH